MARRAVVRGRVQGVFFRASTRDLARELGLSGWVRNDRGGTVTIHVEGPSAEVQRVLEWAETGPRQARVVGVDVSEVAVEGLDSFEIRWR